VCVYDNVPLLHKGFFFRLPVFFFLEHTVLFLLAAACALHHHSFCCGFRVSIDPAAVAKRRPRLLERRHGHTVHCQCCGRRRGRWAPRPARPPRVPKRPRGTHHQVTRRPHSGSRHGKARHPPPKAGPRKTPAPPPSPRRSQGGHDRGAVEVCQSRGEWETGWGDGVGGTVLHYAPGASEFGQEGRGVCVTACREET